MDLLKKEEELQKGARKVLEKLDLIELLSKHGKPKIVGSVAFRLMTWKDIDIVVIVDKLNKQNIAEISAILIKKSSRRIDFTVTDNRKEDGLGKIPRGIYLGLKYFGDDIKDVSRYEAVKDIVWKIDIHFVLKDSSRSIATIEKIKSQLTEEKRLIILQIKEALIKNKKYKIEIFSIDVYKAVLEKGVKNLEEFKEYLKSVGKNL